MKAQILTDFVVKCTVSDNNPEDELNDKSKQIETPEIDLASVWVPHIDRVSNPQDSGAGFILTSFEGIVIE